MLASSKGPHRSDNAAVSLSKRARSWDFYFATRNASTRMPVGPAAKESRDARLARGIPNESGNPDSLAAAAEFFVSALFDVRKRSLMNRGQDNEEHLARVAFVRKASATILLVFNVAKS